MVDVLLIQILFISFQPASYESHAGPFTYITHNLPFRDINKAFELMHKGESLRAVIWMDENAFADAQPPSMS